MFCRSPMFTHAFTRKDFSTTSVPWPKVDAPSRITSSDSQASRHRERKLLSQIPVLRFSACRRRSNQPERGSCWLAPPKSSDGLWPPL